ncbi:unnamed protein product, partial [Enterobius vermicularis]|uniref:Chitin-binding type-2 domain-containing protein n=1 Tax=Enterobius vermicularis TaxID=51028 RepID=A0A0N4VMB3_ENTVE
RIGSPTIPATHAAAPGAPARKGCCLGLAAAARVPQATVPVAPPQISSPTIPATYAATPAVSPRRGCGRGTSRGLAAVTVDGAVHPATSGIGRLAGGIDGMETAGASSSGVPSETACETVPLTFSGMPVEPVVKTSGIEIVKKRTGEFYSAFSCRSHPDGVYPLPGSLSSIVLCHSGDAVILSCPEGLVMDERELKCVENGGRIRGKLAMEWDMGPSPLGVRLSIMCHCLGIAIASFAHRRWFSTIWRRDLCCGVQVKAFVLVLRVVMMHVCQSLTFIFVIVKTLSVKMDFDITGKWAVGSRKVRPLLSLLESPVVRLVWGAPDKLMVRADCGFCISGLSMCGFGNSAPKNFGVRKTFQKEVVAESFGESICGLQYYFLLGQPENLQRMNKLVRGHVSV